MSYTVLVSRRVTKEIDALQAADRERIVAAISALEHEPRPRGVEKLSGTESDYRVRVGSYRIVYSIVDQHLRVELLRVAHRREVYR